jgi:hypothetical protein
VKIPGGHDGESRGVSGDVLGPSGNHSNQEIEERGHLVERSKRERERDIGGKWRQVGEKRKEGERDRAGQLGPMHAAHGRTVRPGGADSPPLNFQRPTRKETVLCRFQPIAADSPRYPCRQSDVQTFSLIKFVQNMSKKAISFKIPRRTVWAYHFGQSTIHI